MSLSRLVLCLSLAVSLSGCASIVRGSTQPPSFTSPPLGPPLETCQVRLNQWRECLVFLWSMPKKPRHIIEFMGTSSQTKGRTPSQQF